MPVETRKLPSKMCIHVSHEERERHIRKLRIRSFIAYQPSALRAPSASARQTLHESGSRHHASPVMARPGPAQKNPPISFVGGGVGHDDPPRVFYVWLNYTHSMLIYVKVEYCILPLLSPRQSSPESLVMLSFFTSIVWNLLGYEGGAGGA